MELKDYRVQPDEGLFEQIQHRLRVRRALRVGGGIAAVVVATAIAVAVVMPRGGEEVAALAPIAVPTEPVAATVEPVGTHVTEVREEPQKHVAKSQKPTAVVIVDPTVQAVPEDVVPAVAPQSVLSVPISSQQPVAVASASVAEEVAPIVVSDAEASEQAPIEMLSAKPVTKNESAPEVPVHYDNVVWAPNVIVPNGDVDENRTFSFKYTSAVSEFRIFIYNRGGRRVFSSSNPEFSWDGSADGTAMPQGAYVWVARFRDSDGRQREEKGSVTIIR